MQEAQCSDSHLSKIRCEWERERGEQRSQVEHLKRQVR
jgi:hypothetical protein